jgi:hypothetical protein
MQSVDTIFRETPPPLPNGVGRQIQRSADIPVLKALRRQQYNLSTPR